MFHRCWVKFLFWTLMHSELTAICLPKNHTMPYLLASYWKFCFRPKRLNTGPPNFESKNRTVYQAPFELVSWQMWNFLRKHGTPLSERSLWLWGLDPSNVRKNVIVQCQAKSHSKFTLLVAAGQTQKSGDSFATSHSGRTTQFDRDSYSSSREQWLMECKSDYELCRSADGQARLRRILTRGLSVLPCDAVTFSKLVWFG